MWVFGGCVLAPLLTTWSRGLCGRCSLRTETSYANFSCFKVLNPPIVVQLKVLLLEYFIFLISTELHRQRLQRMFFYCVSYFGETVCSSRKLPWSPCSTLLVLVPACKLKNVQFISKNCVLYLASKSVWNGSLTIFRIFFYAECCTCWKSLGIWTWPYLCCRGALSSEGVQIWTLWPPKVGRGSGFITTRDPLGLFCKE